MTNSIPVNEFVTDTMGMSNRLERRRLGPIARTVFEQTEAGRAVVHVPSMVFAEMLYLNERHRIEASLADVLHYLREYTSFREHALTLDVVLAAAQITDVPELHDRLIAGVARLLDLPLITNDPVIQASAFVRTMW